MKRKRTFDLIGEDHLIKVKIHILWLNEIISTFYLWPIVYILSTYIHYTISIYYNFIYIIYIIKIL